MSYEELIRNTFFVVVIVKFSTRSDLEFTSLTG